MFFRKWLSYSRKPSTRARRRVRREAGFVQQAIYGGLGVEDLESRQLLSATVLGASAQATPPSAISGQVTSPIPPAVTPGVTPTAPSLVGLRANSPPSVSAPPTGNLNENSTLSFSAANGNAISITDTETGTNADSLTLSVSQGTLTLPSSTGLSFTSGANGSSSFTVIGTVAGLDSALDGLVYQPTTLYSGADSLVASVTNPTGTLSASTSVSIAVAPLSAPAISAPASGSLSENGSLTLSSGNSDAISITDAAAGSNVESLTLSAAQGILTLASSNGLSFTSGVNGSSSFTVSGPVTDLNAALDGLVYQPTSLYSGSDSLSVSVTDPGDSLSASTSVGLTVTALSAPTISVPGSPGSTGDASLAVSGDNGSAGSFTDSTAGADSDSLSQSVSQGTALGSATGGLSFTAGTSGSATFTASSPVTSVNSALNAVTYPGGALSSSTSASLTVNALAAPVSTAPVTAPETENISLAFPSGNTSGISVIDAAAGSNSDALSLSVSRGTLTSGPNTGSSFTTGANGSLLFTATGTIASLHAGLGEQNAERVGAGVTGGRSIRLSAADPTDRVSNSSNVALTDKEASPRTITTPATGSMSENRSLAFSTGNHNVVIFTNAAGASTDSLTVSVVHGMLTSASNAGSSFTGGANGSASFTVSGSAANLNAALDGSTLHVESDSVSLSDSDRGDTLSAATTVVFTVSALSAPVIVAPPSATLDQNQSLVFSTGNGNAISIFSFNGSAGSGLNSVTLSVAHGTITLPSTTGLTFTTGINGSASFTVTGTAANLNAALSGLVYTPTRNFSGSDSLAMQVLDPNGQSALTGVALRVNVIAPTLAAPTTGTVPQNGTLTFYKRAIQIADVNASTDMEQVVLTATRGALRLGSTTGITFVSGANNSASMTISGTLTSLNAGLNGLKFAPTTNYAGSGTIGIKYTDAKNGLSVSTNIAVAIGTTHASFGPSIPTTSPQATVISPASQPPSTAEEIATSPNLSATLPDDDSARWDRFMAEMGLPNGS